MKGVVSLAILSLLVCSAVNAGSSSSETISRLREKERSKTCHLQCKTSGGSKDSGNWIIQITGEVDIYVIYNKELNFFGILNFKTNIAILINGGANLLVITNVKVGGSIIINVKTQVAIFVKGKVIVEFQDKSTIAAGFLIIFNLSETFKGKLERDTDVNSGNYFSITAFIQYIYDNGDVKGYFGVRVQLGADISANFKDLFSELHKLLSDGTVSIGAGVAVIIAPVLELTINLVGDIRAIYNLVVVLVVRLKCAITVELGAAIYVALTVVNETIEASLNILVKALQGVGVIYTNVQKALEAVTSKVVADISVVYVKIGTLVYAVTSSVSDSNSWSIRIDLHSTVEVSILVSFNSAKNYFAIANLNTGYALVLIGNKGFGGFYNIYKGVGLAINFATGWAKYLDSNSDEIKNYFSGDKTDVAAGFSLIVDVVSKVNITQLLGSDAFDLVAWLSALYNNSSTALIFLGKSKLEANLKANFSVLISTFKNIKYNRSYGTLNLVAFILGTINVQGFLDGFVNLSYQIVTKLSGYFNVDFQVVIFTKFQDYIGGGFVGQIFVSITSQLEKLASGFISSLGQISGFVSKLTGSLGIQIGGKVTCGGGSSANVTGSGQVTAKGTVATAHPIITIPAGKGEGGVSVDGSISSGGHGQWSWNSGVTSKVISESWHFG